MVVEVTITTVIIIMEVVIGVVVVIRVGIMRQLYFIPCSSVLRV